MGQDQLGAQVSLLYSTHHLGDVLTRHRKHELRHTKPYRCNAGDCATKDRGFASQNDLTRHQMTVHRNHELGKTYYCDVGECARRSKPWPRADNFRSHLQRVHKLEVLADADLSRYLHNQYVFTPRAQFR